MKTMSKNQVQKILSCLLAIMLLACAMLLPGCKSEPLVIKDSDTCIVIKTTQEVLEGNADMLLIDYMNKLVEKGELSCTVKDGMITSSENRRSGVLYV